MTEIKFGTDGWRAVVGEDFTPENVRKVAQAFADLYPRLPEKGRPVVIGYDRRNQSPESAEIIAGVLLANNIPVVMSDKFCPTPGVSWKVKTDHCAAGIVVTASHNPPKWNGIKFKESNGGTASTEYVQSVEQMIVKNDSEGRRPLVAATSGHKLLSTFDPYADYLNSFGQPVDLDLIRKQNYRILFEPLYGAGTGFFSRLLGSAVTEIHAESDINFGGLNPEPIPPHVNEQMLIIKKGGYDVGLITDGDADRAGAVDENGKFITTQEVYSLLVKHLVENKKWTGSVVKTVSTTVMLDRLCRKYNLELTVVPVGFKYISPQMKKPGVLIGGEESGGFGIPRHVPERDGIFADLLLLEMMATTQKTLGQLVAEMQRDVGPCCYKRLDNHLRPEQIKSVREKLKTLTIDSCVGRKLKKELSIDGKHFLFEDDSWLLFRASGTEPLVRIYAEAPTSELVDQMLAYGKQSIGI